MMVKDTKAEHFAIPDDHYDPLYTKFEQRRISALRRGLIDNAAKYAREQGRLTKIGRTLDEYERAIKSAALHYQSRAIAVGEFNSTVKLAQFEQAGLAEGNTSGVALYFNGHNIASELESAGIGATESSGEIAAIESGSRFAWIGTVGKYGGTALVIGTEAYMIWQFTHGRVTQRQFIRGQAGFGAGLAAAVPGAVGGAYLGGLTGPAAPVCVPVFAFVGGVVTGITGTMASNAVVDHVYEKLDASQRREVDQFVRAHYAVDK
jgi:hypothetical protein